jgi:arylsulfatase A
MRCTPTLLALAVAACAAPEAARRPAQLPNVVLIMADDLGYGELGCYGQEHIETPRIDALARDGLRFTAFYSAAPVCAPARASLLTGLHGGHAFVRDNHEVKPEGQIALPEGTLTMGNALQAAGYETAAIGKWGLGAPGSSGEPNAQGFDHWFGYLCQREAHDFYPTHLWRDGERVELEGNVRGNKGKVHHSQDLLMDEAEAFLRGSHEQPFLLYVPFTLPHLALQPEDEDLAPYAGRFPEEPYDGKRGYLPHPTPRAAYAAMISRLDADVGRIVDWLEELGLAENTLVLVTSDNGPTHDVGGVDTNFFNSAGPLRGRKGSVYEGGIRVPMVAYWPGHVPQGTTTDRPAVLYDVLPTLLDLANAPIPGDIDGHSFAPTLLGRAQAPAPFLLWEFHGYGGQQAVREGRWKLLRRNLRKGPEAFELYDLESDLGEQNDVAGRHPDVVARLAALLAREHAPSGEFPLAALDAGHLDR